MTILDIQGEVGKETSVYTVRPNMKAQITSVTLTNKDALTARQCSLLRKTRANTVSQPLSDAEYSPKGYSKDFTPYYLGAGDSLVISCTSEFSYVITGYETPA